MNEVNPKLIAAQMAIHQFLNFLDKEKQILPFAGTKCGPTNIVTMSAVYEGVQKMEREIYSIIQEALNEKS